MRRAVSDRRRCDNTELPALAWRVEAAGTTLTRMHGEWLPYLQWPAMVVTVVAAWCAGYPSEIGDRWGKQMRNAVFALYDTKSDGVSFRRSPDCQVDLSKVAETFGGGGHAAAAGCTIPGIGNRDAAALADLVANAVGAVARDA